MSEIGPMRRERPRKRRFLPRLALIGAFALAALVAVPVVLLLAKPASPAGAIADDLAGERWYAMLFRHRPIGHYRAETGRTPMGHYAFRTELHFRLTGREETRMADALVFHRRPPHRLVRAEHESFAGDRRTHIAIADGAATVRDGPDERNAEVEGELHLADYLAVENWLREDAPGVGDTRSADALDFDQLAIVTNRWRVLGRDADGVEVGKDTAGDSTYVRMDNALVPQRMQIGPLFTLEAVHDERIARLWEQQPVLFSPLHDIAVDRPIERPGALTRLALSIRHADDHPPAWMDALPGVLTSGKHAAHTADPDEMRRESAATVNHPADHPDVRRLADRAVFGLVDDGERAAALTGFVHSHLRYGDTAHADSVLETMRDRTGDCTEFANLYTTLARAVGLPARTVVGIAYREGSGGFGLHAWNEVAVDGIWHSVDPTWGQHRADLTHLPLPDDAVLTFIAQRDDLRLEVVEAVY